MTAAREEVALASVEHIDLGLFEVAVDDAGSGAAFTDQQTFQRQGGVIVDQRWCGVISAISLFVACRGRWDDRDVKNHDETNAYVLLHRTGLVNEE